MDEEAVNNLVEVLQLSHAHAQFLLQKFNNDASRAIHEYLENPDVLKQSQPPRGWEESPAFHNADAPGFRIDTSDNVAAPARPPSRSSYPDELIDLTQEHRAADQSKSLSYQDQDREEREIQAAIALSIGETPPGQENGVTTTTQQFGRATREYHDPSRWAMTVSKETAREVVDHPPPANRLREVGDPAFLKASTVNGFGSLGALLTIYHSIPLAREALLLPNYRPVNYGYDPQWWTGNHIELPRTGAVDQQEMHQNSGDILLEVQRLMAFLDGTNRAYGSVDALADPLKYYQRTANSGLSCFLEAWGNGSALRCPDDPLTQVFVSHGVRNDYGSTQQKNLHCLEPLVDIDVDQSLTDPLDRLIWADHSSDQPMYDVVIDHLGDIMTFRVCDPKKTRGKLDIEIPAVWYPDRYMRHFREASRDVRSRRRGAFEELRRLDGLSRDILNCRPAGRQAPFDIKTVLANAADRAPLIPKQQPYHATQMSPGLPLSSAEVDDCVKALKELVATIDTKVAQLEAEKREIQEQIRAITEELDDPEGEPGLSQRHRYSLRGVSTSPSVTYVLRPNHEESQRSEAESPAPGPGQWWRISSSQEDAMRDGSVMIGPNPQPQPSSDHHKPSSTDQLSQPWPALPSAENAQPSSQQHESKKGGSNINNHHTVDYSTGHSTRRVSEADVLEAARQESDTVILVYASDKAVNSLESELSGPLQTFVKMDNRIFENELTGGSDGTMKQLVSLPPKSFAATASSHSREETTQLHFASASALPSNNAVAGNSMQIQDAPSIPQHHEAQQHFGQDNDQMINNDQTINNDQIINNDQGGRIGDAQTATDPSSAIAPPSQQPPPLPPHPPSSSPPPPPPPTTATTITKRDKDGQPSPKRTKGEQNDPPPYHQHE